jgi:ABC-type methionine transport system ATPase subunit
MARQRMKLTYPPDLINQPLIYNMGKQFQVVTNIRRANVSGDQGWMILEISGTDDEIEKALTWATSQGVRIEPGENEIPARTE